LPVFTGETAQHFLNNEPWKEKVLRLIDTVTGRYRESHKIYERPHLMAIHKRDKRLLHARKTVIPPKENVMSVNLT